jgi:diaminohydroxyphosphoribosylaminopyrimidine deaminase/5-amino-6-(5-phosphoribosylamino)uracil reductase
MDRESITKYMKQALQMAKEVKGSTSPNPSVGAILIKNDTIIGKGITLRAGKDHAEVQAIKNASPKDIEGSTLIVTLEPCCFYGRTPPCVEAIKNTKIKEVYIAILDQNPKVNGKSVEILREAGIHVEYGFLEEEAYKINEDFFKWIKTGLPFVTIKYAMTLDGKMATSKHSSKWITGEESRKDSHYLRYQSDAIMIGSNTIKHDNPTLNSRIKGKEKYPLRIILDADGLLEGEHTVIKDKQPTMIVIPPDDRLLSFYNKLIKNNINKAILPIKVEGEVIDLKELLKHLGEFQITSIVVEGGSRALFSLYKQGVIDKVVTYIAPKILSGSDGVIPFHGTGPKDMSQALQLSDVEYLIIGNDIKISGYVR